MINCPRSRHLWLLAGLAFVAAGRSATALAQATPQTVPLSLGDAVRQALESHPSTRSSRAGAVAALASAGEARSQRWPSLALDASLIQFQDPMIVAPLHRFDTNQRPEFDRTLIGGNLSLRYLVFDGGARGALVERSEADAAAAGFEQEATELDLIAAVTETYLQVLTAQGIESAQRRRIGALEAEQARVERLLEVGSAAQVDLLRVQAALAEAEAERATTGAALDIAERNLARLVGTRPEQTRAGRLQGISLSDTISLADRSTLVRRAVAGNPSLAEARERVRATRVTERRAVAAWFPRIEVAAGYQGFAAADAQATAEWQAGIRLSYPIFTGGQRSSAVRHARARLTMAEEKQRLAELATEERIDRAVNAVREWRARVSAGATAVEHLTEVARIEQLALTEGVRTQTDYLRTEADLLRARAQLVRARHAEIAAWVALAQTAGELSTDWLARMLESSS